jgi:hypothetical protein
MIDDIVNTELRCVRETAHGFVVAAKYRSFGIAEVDDSPVRNV